MLYRTYGQLRTELELDLDIQDESAITPDELVGIYNKAVDECEAEIHTLHEDYFLNDHQPTLVVGTAAYAMPSDIYLNKIRGVVYESGTLIYEVKKIRDRFKFIDIQETNSFGLAEYYRYYIKNDAPTLADSVITNNMKFMLVPTSREAGTPVTLWYLRQANRVPLVTAGSQSASDDTVVDIPDFYAFVQKKAECLCLKKLEEYTALQIALGELEQLRGQLRSTLSEMIEDNDNEVELDMSHYKEHN